MPIWEVRCVNKPGPIEGPIDFIERGDVCHTESIFSSVTINGVTHTNVSIGARSDGGVQIRPLDVYPVDYRFAIPCAQAKYDAMLAHRVAQIGKPYDDFDIVEILVDISRRNWRDDKSWICSELETVGLEVGEIIKPAPSSVNKVTPQQVLLILSSMFGVAA